MRKFGAICGGLLRNPVQGDAQLVDPSFVSEEHTDEVLGFDYCPLFTFLR